MRIKSVLGVTVQQIWISPEFQLIVGRLSIIFAINIWALFLDTRETWFCVFNKNEILKVFKRRFNLW